MCKYHFKVFVNQHDASLNYFIKVILSKISTNLSLFFGISMKRSKKIRGEKSLVQYLPLNCSGVQV